MTPFDYLNTINFSKVRIPWDASSEKDYVPFVINRTLSYSPDAVLWVNEINRGDIPKEQQYAYLFGALPKKKRYAKWEKKPPATDDVALVSSSYKYSTRKAEEACALLTAAQLECIREEMNKGGKSCKT